MIKSNLKIKNIVKYLAFTALLVCIIPNAAFAKKEDSSSDFGYDGGWNDTGYETYGSDYYSPSYGYDTGYSYSSPSYYDDYSYDDYSYDYGGDYGGYSYGSSYTPSYKSSGGYLYTPSSSYGGYSYGGSSVPSNSSAVSNPVVNTSATGGNASASASASSSNVNINNNNVYVYTTPTGNAVSYNPNYQKIDGYCSIVPSNPRLGQTVTATAYMTGGVGDYTYTWGGDLIGSAYGVTTSFTSYNPGTKNITVTARSGQDVVTRNCSVTFGNDNNNNGNLAAACYPSYTNVGVNQTVTWRVNPTGGNGNYTYSWSGTDNLYSNNSSVDKTYSYTGQKSATVTVYSNGQSVSSTCYTNVNQTNGSNISSGSAVSGVFLQPAQIKKSVSTGRAVSGVYLNDLPATGIDLSWMHYMIAIMIVILATVATFLSKAKNSFVGNIEE